MCDVATVVRRTSSTFQRGLKRAELLWRRGRAYGAPFFEPRHGRNAQEYRCSIGLIGPDGVPAIVRPRVGVLRYDEAVCAFQRSPPVAEHLMPRNG